MQISSQISAEYGRSLHDKELARTGSVHGECLDINGRMILHAMHFVPAGTDMCKLCICESGHSKVKDIFFWGWSEMTSYDYWFFKTILPHHFYCSFICFTFKQGFESNAFFHGI